MSEKKEMRVQYLTGRRLGKSIEQIHSMLARYDKNIHDKIVIEVVPTTQLAEKDKEIQRLGDELGQCEGLGQELYERYLINTEKLEIALKALNAIKNKETCIVVSNGASSKYNSYQDGWEGVSEFASLRIEKIKQLDKDK